MGIERALVWRVRVEKSCQGQVVAAGIEASVATHNRVLAAESLSGRGWVFLARCGGLQRLEPAAPGGIRPRPGTLYLEL